MHNTTDDLPVFEWVNHAGFIFDYDGVRLLSDPWIDGTAFNNGWALLSKTRFRYQDFNRITHIWFSHEHPDHFSPPNLRRIPEAARKRITVLFQQTLDRKVIRFCDSLGFKDVVELEPGRWLDLSKRLRVLCCPYTDADSWIALQTPEGTILNINDCIVDSHRKARAIRKIVGPVRVLMTQFSYAQWAGNPDDRVSQAEDAREKLERIKKQSAIFQPAAIIPFASFMWFCHEENFWLNHEMNGVARTAAFITANTNAAPVVLYPGQCWRLGDDHDWRLAARAYGQDYQQSVSGGPIEHARPAPYSEIEAAFEAFLQRIHAKNNPLLALIPVPNTTVRVTDADVTLKLTLRGLQRITEPRGGADIATSAESLMYCLRFDWGSSTLHANGRFTGAKKARHTRFFRFFRIADDNNHGKTVSPRWLMTKIVARSQRALSRAWQHAAR
ncbi:MAG: MBL fold metallo-hydrolase [Candidatus Eremiobacteraeota bacterium]|nr:MBL fold metallo-hydrolase [Candidatus Eremiobacteraeota bacterium]